MRPCFLDEEAFRSLLHTSAEEEEVTIESPPEPATPRQSSALKSFGVALELPKDKASLLLGELIGYSREGKREAIRERVKAVNEKASL